METTETIRTPRQLARPHEGRWLGGVAAGLGEYFDLNPAIYRIAFVALALAGGTGILLYLAAWLVIPAEGEDSSVAERMLRDHADRPSRAIGLALLAFFAILALSEAHWWPSPGNLWLAAALAVGAFVWWEASPRGAAAHRTDAGSEAPAPVRRRQPLFAIAIGSLLAASGIVALLDTAGVWNVDWRIVLGAMVVFTGGIVAVGAAAGLRVGGVAGVGVVLLAALALVLSIRVPLFAGWGDQTVQPTSVAALDSTYEHGVGNYTLDLHDLRLPTGTTHVTVKLAVGDLLVRVPANATVDVEGRVALGEVRLFGHTDSGGGIHDHVVEPGRPARVLALDARTALGVVEVVRG
ncbi:MAG TPA: PspC domain-containing protein [Gaiellaceae bacterium]|nr:PspC domain-containing protein [Gaiellaceae bacterium]